MIELILPPLLAGLVLIASLSPLGCFVLWRRMAFFGDTIAHSMLIGIALGLALDINLNLAILVFASIIAVVMVYFSRGGLLPRDALLSIVSHASLAVGLLVMSLFSDQRLNLMNFLVGDILSVSWQEVGIAAVVSLAALALLIYFWRALLGLVINRDLSQVEGDNSAFLNTLLMLITAIVIAIAVRIVGVLLITALMVIPAASARLISRSPEAMALLSVIYGCLSLFLGLALSFFYNSATGPTIVSVAALLLALTACAQLAFTKRS
ncbi:iron chelate uptake ABC transporter family permease subunit [Agaribacterium sp. ZY112]|uniref:iron chelate uptake ABC transporter family permease subunit n=1 Tax=Agaribacterium sp. ZY112 TaxID=3233574 RepID=UPI003525797E